MKKILFLLLIPFVAVAQPDSYTTQKNYIDNNIKTNGTRSITGPMVNTALTYLLANNPGIYFDATRPYKQNQCIVYQNAFYVHTADVAAGSWSATNRRRLFGLDSAYVKTTGDTIFGNLLVNGDLSADTGDFVRIGIGISSPTTEIYAVNDTDNAEMILKGTGSYKRGIVTVETTDTIHGAGHESGRVQFVGRDDANNRESYGDFVARMAQTKNGSEEGLLIFRTRVPGQTITNSTMMTLSGSAGLALKTGADVNEFSTDTTMGGNSDDAVPTEKAVKTYVTGYTQPVYLATVTLDSTQMKSLGSGTIEILNNPGTGKAINVLNMFYKLTYTAPAFNFTSNLIKITWGVGIDAFSDNHFDATSTNIREFQRDSNYYMSEDDSLVIEATGGGTQGGSSVKIYIYYTIITP